MKCTYCGEEIVDPFEAGAVAIIGGIATAFCSVECIHTMLLEIRETMVNNVDDARSMFAAHCLKMHGHVARDRVDCKVCEMYVATIGLLVDKLPVG